MIRAHGSCPGSPGDRSWHWTTLPFTTRPGPGRPPCRTFPYPSRRARAWRWWGRPGPANRPYLSCCNDFTIPSRAGYCSMAKISASSACGSCAAILRWCRNSPHCLPVMCATTSAMADRTLPTPRWSPPPGRPTPKSSSNACPRAMAATWASRVYAFQGVSASALPWPGRYSMIPKSCCWMRLPARWTPRANTRSSRRCTN